MGTDFRDLDNDGWKDIFVTRGDVLSRAMPGTTTNQFNSVFRNPGASGKWAALTEEAGLDAAPATRHRGLALGDLDGDGRMDVVTTAIGGPAEIWINRSPQSSHWLDIALEGVKSNRLALNARVRATAGDLVQLGEVISGGSYLSQNDLRLHFGLGSHDRLDKAEIIWPNGKVELLLNLLADRFYVVREGSGVISSKPAEAGKTARP